jgi:repressor LexA
MMKTLSAKQQSILRFIRDFIREHDYPPSIRDIQEACSISSTSVVDYNLKALERLGHIRRDREVSRAIELVGRRKSMSVPVVGQIAAGIPIAVPDTFEHQEFEEDVDVPAEVAAGGNVFALRVKGTSMIDALVNDGDIVVLESTSAWDDGDMVAAWIKSKEETTLKRIYHEGERIRLQPANTTMDPIYAAADDVEVQGKVVYRIGY